MSTYILYVGETEQYRGTLPDCLDYMDSAFCYANDPVYHLVILLPKDAVLEKVSASIKELLSKDLSYSERIKLNKKIVKEHGKNQV